MKHIRRPTGWSQFRESWKTLRFRLMLWNAVIVILTAIATLAVVREGVRWALVHELDQILIEDIREIEIALRDFKPSDRTLLYEELDRKARGHREHGWIVELRDARGDVVWSSTGAKQSVALAQRPTDLHPVSTGGYRLVDFDIPDSSAGISNVRVGASLALLTEDMARIDRWALIAASIVLLSGPLFGYWLAGRATQPVATIIQSANQLRPSQLHERLPIRGSGDELDQIAHTINAFLDRIADYLDRKRDFLANAAHELRTPLAAIRSSIEVALTQARSTEEYQELLGEVIEESTVLETLVNQLLLLSETESDRLKTIREKIDFDSIVAKSADMFQGVAESRDVELRIERLEPCVVNGNRHHLRQVVNNLLDNAIKFTPDGGSVIVALTADRGALRAVLTVRDTGRGIPPDDLNHIFDRFFRGDRSRFRDGATKGTGLGLSICQAVVAAHGGEIQAESRVNTGTTMTVRLPLYDKQTQKRQPRTAVMSVGSQ